MTLSALALFAKKTADEFFAIGLEVARVLGLPVTSWRAGDPTRADFKFVAEALEVKEEIASQFAKSAFLSTAEGDWKRLHAVEVYGVTPAEDTYATPDVTLLNSLGGRYEIAPGDITVKASVLDKTYHNTTGGTLTPGPGSTLTLTFEADEPGAASSVAANEVDELVTTMLGVTIQSSTAASARDAASPEEIDEQCAASLGALSPNGPDDAYEYVVRNSELTGVTDITRAWADGDSADGTVTIYVASATGAVAGGSITAAQDAVEQWATPLCHTPTVVNATTTTIDVDGTVSGLDLPADFEALCQAAIVSLFAATPIARGSGVSIALSAIVSKIQQTLESNGASRVKVVVTTPAAEPSLAAGAVPVLGTFNLTEV